MKIPPNTRDITTCRRCRATIRLVEQVNGKRTAVNLDPDPTGRLVAYYDDDRGSYRRGWFAATNVTQEDTEGGATFRPHSDICRPKRSRA